MTKKTQYVLRKNVLAQVPSTSITRNEFQVFKHARSVLTDAFEIEETYEVMITNYVDLEKQLLHTSATYMVRSVQEYSDFFLERVGLNARFINLLTATKMYIDQIPRYARDCIRGNKSDLADFKKLFSDQYDSVKEYRFIEALRNHVQHYGLPVHSMKFNRSWTSLEKNGLLEHSTKLFCQRLYLEKNKKFKQSVLEETEENIDLIFSIRRYIESLSEIHDTVRTRIEDVINAARLCIEDGNNRYAEVYDEALVGLCAMKMKDNQKVEEISLTLEWDNIRQKLQKRNPKIVNLKKRFVSSSVYNERSRNSG